jgi:lipopolysaccharide cholinephosphotransferase
MVENVELKQLQKIELELLDTYVSICNKNNLRYYLGGGTMLGAIRHKGFIPWDDDIDIDMPRNDYDKFLSVVKSGIDGKPYYKVRNFFLENDYYLILRLVDTRYEVKTKYTQKEIVANPWIDIVPIDGMPENKITRKLHWAHLLFNRMCFRYSMFSTTVTQNGLKENRPWYESIMIKLGTILPVEKIFNSKKCAREFDDSMRKYDFYSSAFAGNLQGPHRAGDIFSTKWYGDGKMYEFEGRQVRGAVDYDSYLKHLYGYYMKLPPEDKRDHHKMEIVSL